MSFVVGLSGGALFVPTPEAPASTTYLPVRAPVPDIAPYYEVLGDLWEAVDGKEPIEAVWKSVLQFLAGELLQYWEALASQYLNEIPILSQRKWVKFDIQTTEKLQSDPAWTETGTPSRFVYDTSTGTLQATFSNRLGLDAYVKALNGTLTHEARVGWTVEFTADSLPTPSANKNSVALFGYSADTVVPHGLYAGVGRDDQLVLLHIDGAGIATHRFGIASKVVQGTRYKLVTTYTGTTAVVLEALLYSQDEVLVNRVGAGQGGVALDDADDDPYTGTFQDTAVDFGTSLVEVGDRIEFVDPDTGSTLFTSTVASLAGDTLVISDRILLPGEGPTQYRILGDKLQDTASLTVGDSATDERLAAVRFGLHSLDLANARPQSGQRWQHAIWDSPIGNPIGLTVHELIWDDPTVDSRTKDIPYLQPNPLQATGLLQSPADFVLSNSQLLFYTDSPATLYAEYVRYDEGVIESNFGSLVGLSESSTEEYLGKVKALFYAFWKGATLSNVHRGVHIYLGLPIALEAGTVTVHNPGFSGTHGKLTVAGRDYLYPLSVGSSLAVNDEVTQFQPLCGGARVQDYVSEPLWWRPYVSGGFNEMEKFHTFEVVIDADIFDPANIADVVSFLTNDRFKPTWKRALILLEKKLSDAVIVNDTLFMIGRIILYDTSVPGPDLARYDSNIAYTGISFEDDAEGNPVPFVDFWYDQTPDPALKSAVAEATGITSEAGNNNFSLGNKWAIPTTISITDGVDTVTDAAGNGTLSGDGTGTIDYTTGAVVVDFTTDSKLAVTVTYDHTAAPPYSRQYLDPATLAANLDDVRQQNTAGWTWARSGTDLIRIGPLEYAGATAADSTLVGQGHSGDAADPGKPGSSELLIIGGEETTGAPPDIFYDGYPEQGPDDKVWAYVYRINGVDPAAITWFGGSLNLANPTPVPGEDTGAAVSGPNAVDLVNAHVYGVTLTAGVQVVTSDDDGVLTGDGTGQVDFINGTASVTFDADPTGNNIVADYSTVDFAGVMAEDTAPSYP